MNLLDSAHCETHHVPEDRRAGYAATANTAIGAILLAAGALGGALSFGAPEWAVAGYAAMAALGGALAMTLEDAEAESRED